MAGNIASDVVAKAPPDGYTLLYTVSSSFTVNPWIYSKLTFDPEKEFRPVSPLLSQGAFIVANNDTPFKTVKELVDYATANPGKLAYGTNGVGSFLHLIMELFNQSAQVQMLHVPYKGPPIIDVVSGHIPMCVEPAASAIPMINSGKVRAIAFSGPRRHAQFPNVPTISETYSGRCRSRLARHLGAGRRAERGGSEAQRRGHADHADTRSAKADRRNGQRANECHRRYHDEHGAAGEADVGRPGQGQENYRRLILEGRHASQLYRPVHLPGKRRPERPAGICATHRLRDA